jgi:hypothetical protein
MAMGESQTLLDNLDKLRTTEMGVQRIKRNLALATDDVAAWGKRAIKEAVEITRRGKNWYVATDEAVLTVNAHSYTISTAHKKSRSAR